MRSNFSLRTATAVVGALGLVAVGLGQAVPTPNWTADSATLSGHAAGPVLDTRISPNGTYVASIVTKAGTAGGLEVRVRNASDGTFLWSADMGPAPAAGLPRIAFSNDSSRLYFSSDADAGATFDGQFEAKVPATGANVAGFPINDADTDFIKTRTVTSPNGTWFAYEDARQPAANVQPQIIIRNTSTRAIYARVNIGGGGGPYPDIRDFQFTNNGTDGELIVAQADGNLYKVNLFSGVTVSYSASTGSSVNRIERIPGDTTNFMVARESGTTLESLTYAAGATTRSYTNVPAGAKRGFAFSGTHSGTGVAYMMVAVGLFDFSTYVRVDTGDVVAQYDLRRTGQPSSDSRMRSVATYGGNSFFGAEGTERVLSVGDPAYNMDINPVSFIGGTSTTGKIILPGVAPAGGYLVNMTYGANTAGPATVTVPAGASEQTFTITSLTVDASTPVTITATFPHFVDNDSVTLTPILVSAVTITPDPAPNSSNSTGSVTLNAPVTSNRTVALAWSPIGNFAVAPASVTVLAGSDTANFTFKSNVIPAGFAATVTGSLNTSSVPTNFNVAPVSLETTMVYPANAFMGQKVLGTVRLSAPRASDLTVNVTSSNTTIMPNQSVLIPAGMTYGFFTATLGSTTTDRFTTITLTSSGGGEVRTDAFIVRPPTNALASGYNLYYSVGDGLTRNREFFSVMNTTENVRQVVSCGRTTVILKSDGTVWTVGQGNNGQHGDGTIGVTKTTPAQVPGLPAIRQIAGGYQTVYAIDNGGEVWSWGLNSSNQAGQSGGGTKLVPGKIVGLANIVTVGCNAQAGFAIDGAGDLWSWGSNSLGSNGRPGNTYVPAKMPAVTGPFVGLGTGSATGFAIHADGSIYGWGRGTSGEHGDGLFTTKTAATLLASGTYIRQIVGGATHTVALRALPHGGMRSVLTTGQNTYGQRGDGTAISAANKTSAWGVIANATNLTEIASGTNHSMYIGAAAIRTWGYGAQGERADGTFTTSVNVPSTLPASISASNVLAGSNNSISLTAARSAGRAEALLSDGLGGLKTVNFRTNSTVTLSGSIPVGHTVVGGGEVGGTSSTLSEVITMDGARGLFFQQVTGAGVMGTSTSTGITLGANENLVAVANFNNSGRGDFITVDSVTGDVVARLFSGTAQTGTYNLYTLGANETVAGVGDFNVDGFQDLLIFNTSTSVLTTRLYKLGVFQGVANFTNAPLTPTVPAAIPAVGAGYTVLGGAETNNGYGYELVLLDPLGAFEVWDMSRLNRVSTGNTGPAIPVGYTFVAFWR